MFNTKKSKFLSILLWKVDRITYEVYRMISNDIDELFERTQVLWEDKKSDDKYLDILKDVSDIQSDISSIKKSINSLEKTCEKLKKSTSKPSKKKVTSDQ